MLQGQSQRADDEVPGTLRSLGKGDSELAKKLDKEAERRACTSKEI